MREKIARIYFYLREKIAVLSFYVQKNKGILLTLGLSFLFVGWLTSWQARNGFANFWNSWFGLLGVLLTVGLTFFYAKKEWQDSLEKRLTVHFKLKDKYLMTCHEAYLASEGDIRAWGQQIGQQMTNGTYLNFYPYLSQSKAINVYDDNKKVYYRKYEVTFHLKDLKSQIEEGKRTVCPTGQEIKTAAKCANLEKQYLVWWENDDQTAENKAIWFEQQPKQPKSIEEAIKRFKEVEEAKG